MITEQELELALELRDKIKLLKNTIAKLESVVLSATNNLSSGVSIDGIKIEYNDYTRKNLIEFKENIIEAHRRKLKDLQEEYKNIIETPESALRRILEEDDN